MHAPECDTRGASAGLEARPLRIGFINLMPRAEEYEKSLLAPFARAGVAIEPVWIRLALHAYSSSDPNRIRNAYTTFEEALVQAPFDGLVLTGAPVEEMAFEDVLYWDELAAILRHAQNAVPSTLGLCWGGLALAHLVGVEKVRFEKKLFGVYPLSNLSPEDGVLAGADDVFSCPQSRHSGIADARLERAANEGAVRLLAHSNAAGFSIFESADRRFLMHLGHPEYEPARLAFEYTRDQRAGRSDVERPHGFDVDRPLSTWRSHATEFFGGWARSLRR